MKRLAKGRLLFMFALLTLFLAGCGEPFISTLQPAGQVAQTQYDLMLLSTAIMVGVIIVVTVIFLIVLFKFRRKDDKIPKQVEGSHKLEIIWTVIPILLLLVLAVPTVSATFKLADVSPMEKKNEEGKTDVTVINVKANLYWWEFEYPNQEIVTSQELVVPTDEKVYFNLLSTDVKHSFWIPAVGGKLDTNTENVNKFWLEFNNEKADEVGNLFYGKCAELCGPSHALMDFKVKALPKDEFDAWADAMTAIEEPVQAETTTAQEGQEIFNESCIGCHAVTPTGAGAMGPNLTSFGDRTHIVGYLDHTEENLKNWLKDPESIKPGNKMTGKYGDLSDDEIDALTEYLMGLKVVEE
ncbi:cytochrome c oxidase subunit II [Cytobacillus horneckiae]|uniref:Cytochrome c oxidase subunit 2 n=1 Tax=Cytobacillus horneckiae TaxID=549687 RepID=A0A2N0ZKE9_9BACI|nr:cytochrome c oxidase subunit II [Cytobacillus horneckiae]MBN6889175.1 cytochrome c oxidase subunit II [Cytobacillus horneckiae]MCM3178393.1 cytochrome c oxidase subunit II [Cytobacillus horneckiae]MEC1156868.1 cytochrome c oxidase subunit II [Cytobacillus horneckiae]MED2940467.1 cytochrome c oxidase subunit II [Cytobacillus horneckiae]PKG29991.1 cytochrome c oxidase subunit II [Cytobacillus horneckiae]